MPFLTAVKPPGMNLRRISLTLPAFGYLGGSAARDHSAPGRLPQRHIHRS